MTAALHAPVGEAPSAPVPAPARTGLLKRVRVRSQEAPLAIAFAALVFFFPSEVVLGGPLKSNGAPVRLVGMLCVMLLLLDLLRSRQGRRTSVSLPVVLLLVHLAQALFFFGWAALRFDDDAAGSLRQLLFAVAACGIGMYTAVRVTSLATAHKVVGWLVAGCALSAVVGVLQAVGAGIVWAQLVKLPGMTFASKPMGLGTREGLVRVFGTAAHPIEFAVVLGCCLPLAMHLAIHAATQRARRASLVAAGLMTLALPFALSRGGMICIAIAVMAFLSLQDWRVRAWTGIAGVVALCLAYILVPSTWRAVESLFANSSDDPSIQGRLDDYPIVDAAFNASPILGGAPMPPILLDNQWLITLTGEGLVGVALLAALFVVPAWTLVIAAWRYRGVDRARASLAAALAGGIVAIAFSGTVFDLMYFGQAAMLLFFLVGLSHCVAGRRPRASRRSSSPASAGPVGLDGITVGVDVAGRQGH